MDLQTAFYTFSSIQIAWIIVSAIWFWRRGDEFPLLLSLFLFYVFGFRFWALLQGLAAPVNIFPFGFAPGAVDSCAEAPAIGVLRKTTLPRIYMFVQNKTIWVP